MAVGRRRGRTGSADATSRREERMEGASWWCCGLALVMVLYLFLLFLLLLFLLW